MQAESQFIHDGAWFVRKGAAVRGLFPFGAIAQDLMLGRIDLSAEISKDGQQWTPLLARPDLLPAAMLREQTPGAWSVVDWSIERYRAGMRWADERSGRDRRASAAPQLPDDRRRPSDRRLAPQRLARCAATPTRDGGDRRRDRLAATLLGALLLVGVLALFAGSFSNPVPVRVGLPVPAQQSD